jgi:hypothetical protein
VSSEHGRDGLDASEHGIVTSPEFGDSSVGTSRPGSTPTAETGGADVDGSEVAEATSEAARTGEPGNGNIFIMPVDELLQVRTGKEATDAV